MRIEFIVVPDDLAAEADRLWPDSTWSEVVEYGLALAVQLAHEAGEDDHREDPDASVVGTRRRAAVG